MIESPILFNTLPDVSTSLAVHLDALEVRAAENGGFAPDAEGAFGPRPDTTAWAILALEAAGRTAALAPARNWLVGAQAKNGRVSMDRANPAASWPTPLAILAWLGSADHAEPLGRSLEYLLELGGITYPRSDLVGHDTTLIGWPWVEVTHSWVEPTALARIALLVTGRGAHARAEEARRLLLDRQLEEGGWNYGNTTALGQVQRPTPDSTGVALAALVSDGDSAGAVDADQLEPSLDYLGRELARVRTPLSLAWGLLGSSAWNRRPEGAGAWCLECLDRQESLGAYDTALLAAVLFAAHASAGIVDELLERRAA